MRTVDSCKDGLGPIVANVTPGAVTLGFLGMGVLVSADGFSILRLFGQ